MKKTILTIALLSTALASQASPTPEAKSAGQTAAAVAVAGASMAAAAVATAATGGAAIVPAAAAAAAAIDQATVSITGASTVAGAPLMMSLKGEKAAEPSFQTLFDIGRANPKWTVVKVVGHGDTSRLFLKSASSNAMLDMDVATSLVTGLAVKAGAVVAIETQSSGNGALIKFVKDKTPLGFMVNKNTAVNRK